MAGTQETNTTKFRSIEEAVFGTTPASGFWSELRITSQTAKHKKDTVKSNEIQPGGNVVNLIQVGQSAEGDMQFEFTANTFNRFIEGALRTSFGLVDGGEYRLSGTDLDAATADDSYNRAAGSFVTEGFIVNQWVRITGFANAVNNGYHKLSAVAALKLTAAGLNLTTEASGPGRTITGYRGVVAGEVDLDAATADDSFNRTVGSFITDGFKVGQWVMTYGFADPANAGPHLITALTALKMTVAGSNLVNEAAGPNRAIIGKMARNGTKKRSYSMEEEFPGIPAFIAYSGMRVATWVLTVTAKALITGSFSFMGKKGTPGGATAVVSGNVAANTNTPVNGATNVGNIMEAGVALATGLRQIVLNVANNLRNIDQIGSLTPVEINAGFCDVTGSVEAYFETLALYNKFYNHTSTSLHWRVTDVDGNMMMITLPKVQFSEGDPTVGGVNQDVVIPLPFVAIYDPTTDCSIQVDILPAAA